MLATFSSAERAAALSWARKELPRTDLIEFARYVHAGYQASEAHRKLASALERVLNEQCNRLIVNFPRRHGKSLLVSQLFPCFAFGRNPKLRIAQCGYAESLTTAHSRRARDILIGRAYHDLFPAVVHQARREVQQSSLIPQTAHEWGTAQGGSYYAVGVGGGLAGRGFHIGIIDDPIRGRAEAASKLQRDKVWDWFRGVFYPAQDSDEIRREAAIIIVMTRWHQDDLAARVQKVEEESGETSDNWEVLSLPAISSDGEALWPERWPLEKLHRIRQIIGSVEFSAQYMQSPKPMDGNTLDSSKLVMEDPSNVPPIFVKVVRRWDLAFSEDPSADWVAGAKLGLDKNGHRWILHAKRMRARWPKAKPEIIRYAVEDGLGCVCAVEANGTQLGYYQDVRDDPRMVNRLVVADHPEGSKEMRASVWGSRLQDGIIHCVRGPWNQELFDEMDYFGSAEHDDLVDAVSGAWAQLSVGGMPQPVAESNRAVSAIAERRVRSLVG